MGQNLELLKKNKFSCRIDPKVRRNHTTYVIAIQVVEFSRGDTKLERFLPLIKKLTLSKNVDNKQWASKLIFFNEKRIEKDSNVFCFDIED